MDRKEFMVWLRKRKFERPAFDTYEARYQSAIVRVNVGRSHAETVLIEDGSVTRLARYGLADLVLNRYKMVQGAGLTDLFTERVFGGEPFPDWFTGEYKKATRARIEKEKLQRKTGRWPIADRQRILVRGRKVGLGVDGKLRVALWARQQGFRQAGHECLEARYGRDIARIVLMEYGILSSRISMHGNVEYSFVEYSDLMIDQDGMLRGANLVTPFMEEVMDGGELPSWFPADFVQTHADEMEAAGIDVQGAGARHAPPCPRTP